MRTAVNKIRDTRSSGWNTISVVSRIDPKVCRRIIGLLRLPVVIPQQAALTCDCTLLARKQQHGPQMRISYPPNSKLKKADAPADIGCATGVHVPGTSMTARRYKHSQIFRVDSTSSIRLIEMDARKLQHRVFFSLSRFVRTEELRTYERLFNRHGARSRPFSAAMTLLIKFLTLSYRHCLKAFDDSPIRPTAISACFTD